MQGINAEKAILGSIINEPKLLDRVLSFGITEKSFLDSKNKEIFETIITASKAGNKLDLISLRSIFPKMSEYLFELSESYATSAHMDSWTRTIKEHEALKRLKLSASEVSASKSHEVSHVVSIIQAEITEINRLLADTKIRPTNDILKNCFEQMQNVEKYIVPYFAVNDIASNCIRHSKREMHVIAANTGVGKTALAVGAAVEQLKAGHVVAYFCFESDSEAIIARIIAAVSGVSHYKALYGTLNMADLAKFKTGSEFVKKHANNLFIRGVETGIMTAESVKAEIQNIIAERGKLDVVIVDFLQAMSVISSMRKQEKHIQVAHITTELHRTFIEFDVAGIVLAQLTKEGGKVGQLPGLEHIKDSSVITQLAHIVSFLSRAQKSTKDAEPVKWYSRKTRNQMPFAIDLSFDGTKYIGTINNKYSKEDEPN